MISVCIPTYNGGKYIVEQLESILKQIEKSDEIIISDDGSTDDTLEKIIQLNDSRITIVHHQKTLNLKHDFLYATLNFENALKYARGNFIYMADQDDIWQPNRVEITQNHLKDYALVCCDCYVMDENGEMIIPSYFDWNGSKKGVIKNVIKNSYLGCCMAFRRELLPKIMPISTFLVPHDIWIGLIGEYYGNVHFDNNKLVGYRRHSSNLSPSGGISENSLFYKFKYRLVVILSLILRIISDKDK